MIFKCLKCSHCCRNLIQEDKIKNLIHGLSIYPKERKLFSSNIISPEIGIGLGISGPTVILVYQLNVKVCPHILDNNKCKIYKFRPLVCKAFPLTAAGFGATIAAPEYCTFVKREEKNVGSLDRFMIPQQIKAPKEWQAISKINSSVMNAIRKYPKEARYVWFFDLKNNEWQPAKSI